MNQIFIPGQNAVYNGPFGQGFFINEFKEGQIPEPDQIEAGQVPVVELQLFSGEKLDIYYFEQFKRDYIAAQVFTEPTKNEDCFKSYIRYDSIFRINIKKPKAQSRPLGFKPNKPIVE